MPPARTQILIFSAWVRAVRPTAAVAVVDVSGSGCSLGWCWVSGGAVSCLRLFPRRVVEDGLCDQLRVETGFVRPGR